MIKYKKGMASASWKTTGLPKCEPRNISDENLIDDIGYIAIDGEVTAWDSLPKPYKEKIMDFSRIGEGQ